MVASLNDILQGIGDGSGTRGYSQTCYATFKSSYAVFKHTLCRVGQTTVDITCIAQRNTYDVVW